MKFDAYQEVTNRIVAQLEKGVAPWVKPWVVIGNTSGLPENFTTKKPYRGVNVILLWAAAMVEKYSDERWLTYRQAKEIGLQVPKGTHGTQICYYDRYVKDGGNGSEDQKTIPFLRVYTVFNIQQLVTENGDAYQFPAPEKVWPDIKAVEKMVKKCESTVKHGGNRAFFRPSADEIHMPNKGQFSDAAAYYSVLCHEHVHWTGHEVRLDRLPKLCRFGDEAYAAEELVAEIGSAFLSAHFKMEGKLQHPEYIARWLKVLKNDKRAIFTAASQAQKAVDFLLGINRDEEETETA